MAQGEEAALHEAQPRHLPPVPLWHGGLALPCVGWRGHTFSSAPAARFSPGHVPDDKTLNESISEAGLSDAPSFLWLYVHLPFTKLTRVPQGLVRALVRELALPSAAIQQKTLPALFVLFFSSFHAWTF